MDGWYCLEFYFEKDEKNRKKKKKTVTTSFTATGDLQQSVNVLSFFSPFVPLFFSRFGKMSSGLLEPRRYDLASGTDLTHG